MRSFSQYLEGKHVAIIGGAPSIDPIAWDADVIVRINEHAATQGTKADVIYSALANNPKIFFETKVATNLRWFFADRNGRYFNQALGGQFKAHAVNYDTYATKPVEGEQPFKEFWIQRILHEFRCKPFTGILAAAHALSLPTRSVFLTGCDFYMREDRTLPEHKDNHFIRPNQEIVKSFLKYDKRFSCDNVVKETFEMEIVK